MPHPREGLPCAGGDTGHDAGWIPQLYPAVEIVELYRLRWQVEVDLRDLKITLGMDVLKGHKVETVTKEVLIYALVYNLVRLVAAKAAKRQRVSPHRISFIDALRWLQPAKPDAPLPALVVNPVRPGALNLAVSSGGPRSTTA